MASTRISRDDLEAKFRSAQEGLQGKLEDKRQSVVAAATVGGLLLVAVVYLLGRRAGRKKSAVVEIRRY